VSDPIEDIVELQTRLQFQDDMLQKLDEVVIRQEELLDRLQRRLTALEDRLEQLAFEQDQRGAGAAEKPPHY